MQEPGRSSGNLAWTLALFIVVGLASGLYWRTNRAWAMRYDQVELRADSLLSVNYHLEDDVHTLESQLATAADDKLYFDKRLNQFYDMQNQQDQKVRGLQQSIHGQTSTIHRLSQQGDSLALIRDSLESQLEASRDKINWLTDANRLLIGQNKDLEQQLSQLNADLSVKFSRTTLTGHTFLAEPRKANKNVTSKARKISSLLVSCVVPAELQGMGRQEVFLSLTDEKGNVMLPAIRTTTVTLPNLNEVVPVHAAQMVSFTQSPQRIVFQITPTTHVQAGLYRASMYTREAFLGTVEFRLRNSFWFF